MVSPLRMDTHNLTARDVVRLAYTPVSRVPAGQKRFYIGPRYDRSVVFWMLIFAVLNIATSVWNS